MAKSLSEKHPELFHYTTAVGLKGIIETQSLWATHYQYVNDKGEFKSFFQERFPRLLNSCVPPAFAEIYAESAEAKEEIDSKHGGLEEFTNLTLQKTLEVALETASKFYEPYLISLCGAANSTIAKDGLLSQWRGYGSDGGYAIVFDTCALETLLYIWLASTKYRFTLMDFFEVDYHSSENAEKKSSDEVSKLETKVKSSFANYIKTNDKKYLQESVMPTITMALMHKHVGFSEEAEVRIVCIPSRKKEITSSEAGDAPSNKPLEPSFYTRNGLLVPHLTLFKGLPIKRIIIGPHPDTERRKKAVEMLLCNYNIKAEVTCSDIPYIGR